MRTTTWANIGTSVVNGGNKLPAAMDFEVSKQPLGYMFNGEYKPLETGHVTVVDEFGRAYGPVSKSYGVVGNREALGFIENIDGLNIEKYGALHTGVQYLIGSLDKMNVLGDEFTPYLIFRNSFNGSVPLQMAICPLRIVCQNQLNMAFREAQSTINVRHTARATERVHEAQRIICATEEYLKEFNKQAEKYASIKLSAANVEAVIKELFPIKNDMTERVKASVEEKIEEFRKCLNAEDLRNFRGTAWHMIEAYADYRTHLAPKRETSTMLDNKFVSVTFDSRPLLMMMAALNRIAA